MYGVPVYNAYTVHLVESSVAIGGFTVEDLPPEMLANAVKVITIASIEQRTNTHFTSQDGALLSRNPTHLPGRKSVDDVGRPAERGQPYVGIRDNWEGGSVLARLDTRVEKEAVARECNKHEVASIMWVYTRMGREPGGAALARLEARRGNPCSRGLSAD